MWFIADIADAVETGLKRRAAEDDLAQEVYGMDARDELGLHPIIHHAFSDANLGVWPEQRYPGHWHHRRKSRGLRCDVALTHDGLPLRDPQVKGTLFDSPQLAVDPQAAYWLEIKTVAQFETSGAFRRYTSELLSPVAADIKKIWADGVITHGGLLIVLFTATREIAEHDLAAWYDKCIDRGYPVAAPAIRGFPLNDRIGNAWCAAAVFPVRGG